MWPRSLEASQLTTWYKDKHFAGPMLAEALQCFEVMKKQARSDLVFKGFDEEVFIQTDSWSCGFQERVFFTPPPCFHFPFPFSYISLCLSAVRSSVAISSHVQRISRSKNVECMLAPPSSPASATLFHLSILNMHLLSSVAMSLPHCLRQLRFVKHRTCFMNIEYCLYWPLLPNENCSSALRTHSPN